MEKDDARRLSQQSQEQLRKQAIRLKRKGTSFVDIAEILGVHRNAVSGWWRIYETKGAKGLQAAKRGRKKGEKRTLTDEQENNLQQMLCDKTPDQLKLTFALWTRQAVQELIKIQCGITMPIRTVGEYLKRWGFTPQKPLKQAYEQRPPEVQRWLKEEYPKIARRVKDENGEIHWGDETGLRSDSQHGRSYAPKGKTPVIRLSAKRVSINMISTVTNQGKVRFMIYKETMTAPVLIKFMKRLIKDVDRKVFLILDNLRTHHSKKVKAWLQEHTDEIEVFYLPSYSPELNPDEYLNCDLKAGVHSRPPARDYKGLAKRVSSHMRKLQKLPERVMKYFKHPKIAYAAV